MKVMKDNHQGVIRFSYATHMTMEFTREQLGNPQLPVVQEWDARTLNNLPNVECANTEPLLHHIDAMQANSQYTVVSDGYIESITAGTHCPHAVWELQQSHARQEVYR